MGLYTHNVPSAPRITPHFRRQQRATILCRSTATDTNNTSQQTLTQRMFDQADKYSKQYQQSLGAGGGTTYTALKNLDKAWLDLRTRKTFGLPPTFVKTPSTPLPTTTTTKTTPTQYDVIVAGGTLGIFLATALQTAGLSVAVVERGPLQGRAQEWNISRKELLELVQLGVFSEAQIEDCISIEFNPVRVGFHGYGEDVWTRDVLNLGASPVKLVAAAKHNFEAAGGVVIENTSLNNVTVHTNGVALDININPSSSNGGTTSGTTITAKLAVDCMGNQSPIVRQIRHGQQPDGICLVVGACARGFAPEKNTTGDVIYTATHSEQPSTTSSLSSLKNNTKTTVQQEQNEQKQPSNLQLYWEAFPAGSDPTDRTTYMFTYLDANSERPSVESLMELYWHRMPEYQGVDLDNLEVLRILFGMFPTYRDSPLAPKFDRIIQVGDAGGLQSPLSFGGFAALSRHLPRLTTSITEAIHCNALLKQDLQLINAYSPALSGAWMMQRAMSIPANLKNYNVDFVNRLLGGNFEIMAQLGDPTLKPFLQDVIQAGPMAQTLGRQMIKDPLFIPQIFMRVGLGPLSDWILHYIALCIYTGLSVSVGQWLEEKVVKAEKWLPENSRQRFFVKRTIENWQYGAGLDYKL